MIFCEYFVIFFILITKILCQEPYDTTWVSSDCVSRDGTPQMCYPPFTSAASGRKIDATNTCGLRERQKYCIHMSTSGMTSRCQYCDARSPSESHSPEYMTDKNPNNWWQSETMADNKQLHFTESVNLTLDLGTQFHVNYVYLQFKSPRPHAMVIYKKFNDESDWTPWAYFSSNCYTYFGMTYRPIPVFQNSDDAICYEEYSTLQPMYEGEVIFSVINGRPNYENFFTNKKLQEWSTASQIRVELKKMHTFGDERGAERDTLLTYYFGIQKFTVGGRCLCHGHGNECRKSTGPGQKERLVCVCDPAHHTIGDNCEQCSSDYRDRLWEPATPENPSPCKACNCNGNSQLCEFDEELFRLTGSGSRCIGCGNNTKGVNCETCYTGYFPDPNIPTICIPCTCDPVGTVGSQSVCGNDGQCACKPGVGGIRCDRCLDNYFGYGAGGCQLCNCSADGSYGNYPMCDQITGQCLCKENVAGKQCEKCKLGHFGLMSNDPLGCKPCVCSLHTSDCKLDEEKLPKIENEESDLQNTIGSLSNLERLVKPNHVIINCPTGQNGCAACMEKDRQFVRVECNGTAEGFLPCLCQTDPNNCPYCPLGWRNVQLDPRNEICTCPSQYIGLSCETCADGHRRDPPNGSVTDRCIPCTCNGHATKCHPESGQCECQDNTGGLFCDQCRDGYYGNALALVGSTDACKPCPCPSNSKCEQVHWPDRSIKVVCKDCPDNRAGIRCERCAENFYGDPTNGIQCKSCDCSNNVDPREFGNCDSQTGECLKCLFGTTGKHCEMCLQGYRRNFKLDNQTDDLVDFVPARGCSPCNCNPMGTMSGYGPQGIGVCNPETGQCPCKPGVGGLNCDKCYDGFYGFHTGQGCKPCDCNSVGAVDESCNDQTGQCSCRPNVYGLQCDQCLAAHFNMTSLHGCEPCACDRFGSQHSQCDRSGQCECKPFAKGIKCNLCEENHYDLQAGCLPCPPCYNLVQARVNKLWATLESVFGPVKSDSSKNQTEFKPSTKLDDKELVEELNKLNETIIKFYNDVLALNTESTVVDQEHFKQTLEKLLKQVEHIDLEMKNIANKPLSCFSPQTEQELATLEAEINDLLPKLVNQDATNLLENLRKTSASFITDEVLTTHANEIYEKTTELANQMEQMEEQANVKIKNLLSNAKGNLTEIKNSVRSSKDLWTNKHKKLNELIQNNLKVASQIETSNDLIQKTQNQIYLSNKNVDQLPDITSQLIQLEEVVEIWKNALNMSKEIQSKLAKLTSDLDSRTNRLEQVHGELSNALDRQLDQAKHVRAQFDQLDALKKRAEEATNLAQNAYDKAESNLEKLKNFDAYVEEGKAVALEALKEEPQLNERLTRLIINVKDLSNQAKTELDFANQLKNRLDRSKEMLDQLKNKFDSYRERINLDLDLLRNLRNKHEVEIVSGVKRTVDAVETLKVDATNVIQSADESHRSATKFGEEADNLLERMKKLKDHLAKSIDSNGTSVDQINNLHPSIYGQSARTRFGQLKSDFAQLKLDRRLELLSQLGKSRQAELGALKFQLAEFRAHYDHLVKIDSLLPLIEAGCFYIGKGIEGGEFGGTSGVRFVA